jgi:hypothetical protein
MTRALKYMDPAASQRRDAVLQLLAGKKSYPTLLQALRELNTQMESQKKHWLEAVSKECNLEGKPGERSAAYQEVIQKEVDGIVASLVLKEVEEIFEIILSWCRDVALIACKGDSSALFNQEFVSQISERANTPPVPPLEKVMQKIEEARTSLARSMSFISVIETLLLSLS